MLRACVFAAVGVVLFLLESWRPGRRWPEVAGWWLRSLLVSGVQLVVVLAAGFAWDGGLSGRQLWSVRELGPIGGGLLGYFAITFVNYWWHRARHEVPVVWRWLHQLHHSPRRVELITSFYRHPLEIVVNSLLMSVVLYLGVGASPDAAANAVLLVGLVDMFYHTNIRTPHGLGYLIQRPESHCVHHLAGVHSFNYADLPIWDILFGTYRNPRRFHGSCGFGDGEARLGSMLAGVQVGSGIDLEAPVAGTAVAQRRGSFTSFFGSS